MELDFIRKAVQDYEKKQGGCKLNPKAVLFDMDGVLYDSMRFHARAWKEVADAHSLLSSEDDFYMYEGRTGSSTIDELYMRTFQRKATDEEKQAIYEEKSALFCHYNDGEPMPGASNVLEK